MGYLQTTVTATKTAGFTPGPAATIYLIDATASDLTVTLPPAARDAHSVYEFRRIDASGHTVTVAGATDSTPTPAIADTVNGAASTTLATGSALCLVSDNHSGWYDLSRNGGGVADPLVAHAWSGTTEVADETGSPHLIVGGAVGDTNLALATAVVGNDDPAYSLAGILAYSGSGDAISAQSTSGNALLGVALGAGAGVSASNYGSGPAVLAYGYLAIGDSSTPATPTSGIVIWSASGVLKWKGPDGVVH